MIVNAKNGCVIIILSVDRVVVSCLFFIHNGASFCEGTLAYLQAFLCFCLSGGNMEINDLINYLLTPSAQIACIVGVAEIIKRLGFPKKYIPVVDVVLGLISGVCVFGGLLGYDPGRAAVVGVALGLSACGLFSGAKNVYQGGKGDE